MSEPKPINERVASLETRMDAVDRKFDDNQTLLLKFFDKFDDHTAEEAVADTGIQVAMTRIAETLETTNQTLGEIRTQSASTTSIVHDAQASWKVIVVIASVVATLVSGGWAVYQFVHTESKVEQKK